MTSPVLLFVFNRMDTTARVFDRIAEIRPDTLLIVADGPRSGVTEDLQRCAAVRSLVTAPSWPCDLRLAFSDTNMGFNRRISSGLSWAFAQFDELIILEDDCLPDPTFFPFCTELLRRHSCDERVKMISGCNFQFGRLHGPASYYPSRSAGTWGWASWKRAFEQFDPAMLRWPEMRAQKLVDRIWPYADVARYWEARFDEAHEGRVDSWDYQWALSMWMHDGVQLVANQNLIRYIGCRPDAAHTNEVDSPFCEVPSGATQFPLVSPTDFSPRLDADLFEFYRVFMNLEEGECDRRVQARFHRTQISRTNPGVAS